MWAAGEEWGRGEGREGGACERTGWSTEELPAWTVVAWNDSSRHASNPTQSERAREERMAEASRGGETARGRWRRCSFLSPLLTPVRILRQRGRWKVGEVHVVVRERRAGCVSMVVAVDSVECCAVQVVEGVVPRWTGGCCGCIGCIGLVSISAHSRGLTTVRLSQPLHRRSSGLWCCVWAVLTVTSSRGLCVACPSSAMHAFLSPVHCSPPLPCACRHFNRRCTSLRFLLTSTAHCEELA